MMTSESGSTLLYFLPFVQVDFVQWLDWELEIESDPLSDWERESYLQRMLFDSYLNTCPGGGSLDVEVALCHVYNTLTHHHTKPGFNNLIPLLQEICNSLPPDVECPSLLRALSETVKEAAKVEGITLSESRSSYLRLLSYIPSFLLFSNTLAPERGHLSDAQLLATSQCLKTVMVHNRDVVMETAFTHYVCKGLLAVERATDDRMLCQRFMRCSPLFSASLSCSWQKLSHLFSMWKLPHVSTLFDWISSCREVPSPPPPSVPHHVLAACLVKLHLNEIVPDLRPVIAVLPIEVVFIMADFTVRLMTLPSHSPHVLISLVKACTDHFPLSLGVCLADFDVVADHASIIQSSREEFPFQCGSNLQQQLAVVFFKILQAEQVNIDQFLDSSLVPILLPVVLVSHRQCIELASSPRTYQAWDEDFIEHFNSVTKRFICAASTATLQASLHLSHSALKPYLQLHTSSNNT